MTSTFRSPLTGSTMSMAFLTLMFFQRKSFHALTAAEVSSSLMSTSFRAEIWIEKQKLLLHFKVIRHTRVKVFLDFQLIRKYIFSKDQFKFAKNLMN